MKSQLEERARSEKEKADAVHDARAAVEKQRSTDLDAAKLAFEAETRAAILTAERDLEVRFSDERTRTRRQTEDAQQDLIKQLQQEAEERQTQAVNDAKRIAAEQMEVETAAMQAEHEERISAEIANVRWQANEEHEKALLQLRKELEEEKQREIAEARASAAEETLTKLSMARLSAEADKAEEMWRGQNGSNGKSRMDVLADKSKASQDIRTKPHGGPQQRISGSGGPATLLAQAAANNVGYDAALAPLGGALDKAVDLSAEGPTPPGAPRRRANGISGQVENDQQQWMRPAESSGPSPRARQMANARATASQMTRVGIRGSVQAAGARSEAEAAAMVLPPLTPGRSAVEGPHEDVPIADEEDY